MSQAAQIRPRSFFGGKQRLCMLIRTGRLRFTRHLPPTLFYRARTGRRSEALHSNPDFTPDDTGSDYPGKEPNCLLPNWHNHMWSGATIRNNGTLTREEMKLDAHLWR